MAGKIFINYRRDDSISTAGRLHDRLAQTFGRKNLFMDVDHIPAGVDFVDYLPSQVAACDVFLAVIGPNWLDAKDDDGRRRFDNPDDFVTIEIAAALARNIRVIPVLVDGARTPKADKLPDSIKLLVRRNAVEVRNTNFGRDAEALITKVHEALKTARPVTRRWPFIARLAERLWARRMVAGSATALLLVGWIGYQMGVPVWVPSMQWMQRAQQPEPRVDKAKAAADAEAKRKAAEAEQQRQAKAEADADAKLKAAEAEQQRLKEEVQRQAKAAADAEAQRKADEAERQRLAAAKAEEERKAKVETQAAGTAGGLFTIKSNTEAFGNDFASEPYYSTSILSIGACEETCARDPYCRIFAYKKRDGMCYRYTSAEFKQNERYDSGIRMGSEAEQKRLKEEEQRLAAAKAEEERRKLAESEARARYNALVSQLTADMSSGDYDRTIATATEAIRLNPNYANPFISRGIAYSRKADTDRAITDYNEAIRLDPTNAIAFYNRGVAYDRKNDYDRAIADYNETIQLDPKNSQAINFLVTNLCRRGKATLKINEPSGYADIAKARELRPSACR